MINILLIGFGPHARRIYYPISIKHGNCYGFKIVHAIDLLEQKEVIENYFNENGYPKVETTYLLNEQRSLINLKEFVVELLNKIVEEKNIKGVIIILLLLF